MEGQDQFQIITTADGSPTLVYRGEPMHSRQGAWAETLYVYGTVVDMVLERNWMPQFLSLGLGLGYVELMVAAKMFRHADQEILRLATFEEQTVLTDRFLRWLQGEPHIWTSLYDQIFARISGKYLISKSEVVEFLRTPRWDIQGVLASTTKIPFRASGIFFDAFSESTSPELWRQDFLENFLDVAAAERCVLATYASKGALKRALKNKGFEIIERPGFGTKRESTLAVRA